MLFWFDDDAVASDAGWPSSPPARYNERTVAEFFAGIGLVRLGLERAGWRVRFANDIDVQKYRMYHGHFRDAEPQYVLGDVHKLSPSCVPTVTLATASFPCNDLSLAGARGGLAGENSSAFWGFVDIVEAMGDRRPPLILLENVTGFLTSNGGADLHVALKALNRLGYAVDVFQIDAASFVPQSRQRLFIVGAAASLLNFEPHSGTTAVYQDSTRPKAVVEYIVNHPDIGWMVRRLPPLPASAKRLSDILEDLPADAPEWWSAERAAYLLSQMSPKHRAQADQMIAGEQMTYGTVFRRIRHGECRAELRADGIAGCLRTPRGGSGRQILFEAGRGTYRARLLTPRECARLMGADEFVLEVPLNQALFGFGDAVCVPVIAWIAHNYLNPIMAEICSGGSDGHQSAECMVVAAGNE